MRHIMGKTFFFSFTLIIFGNFQLFMRKTVHRMYVCRLKRNKEIFSVRIILSMRVFVWMLFQHKVHNANNRKRSERRIFFDSYTCAHANSAQNINKNICTLEETIRDYVCGQWISIYI